MKRVCSEPGCPTLTDGGRCPAHRRERDRQRGSAARRGYGPQHKALRSEYQRRMNAGEAFFCWRCGGEINPMEWDLGHRDDRSGYAGPECIPCNRAVSGR